MKHFKIILPFIIITLFFVSSASAVEDSDLACTTLWAPVCGVDGHTYSNFGCAAAAGVDVAYGGECWTGICGECMSDYDCPDGTRCNAGDVCMTSCECPMCDVCAGQCVPLAADPVTGTRDLPDYGRPDTVVQACYDINVDENNVPNGLIINETIPEGWKAQSCTTSDMIYDPATGKMKWLFYGSNVKDRKICCNIHIPSDEEYGAVKRFRGHLLYNNPGGETNLVAISGDQTITIQDLPQSCDENHDWKIDDFEMLDFIDMWAVGSYCWDPATGKYKAGAQDASGACQ